MAEYGVLEARDKFSSLVEKAAKGEEVVITRHGKALVRFVPASRELSEAEKQRARTAMAEIKAMRKDVKPLGDIAIRDLINEGRRF